MIVADNSRITPMKTKHQVATTLARCRTSADNARAVARAAGWTAHAREQQRTGRLIRPSSLYLGPKPAHAPG